MAGGKGSARQVQGEVWARQGRQRRQEQHQFQEENQEALLAAQGWRLGERRRDQGGDVGGTRRGRGQALPGGPAGQRSRRVRRELFGTVVGPDDPLWPAHVEVVRQVFAKGGVAAGELAAWLGVARQRAEADT